MSTRGWIVRLALTAGLIALLWDAGLRAALPSQEAVVRLSPQILNLQEGEIGQADIILENGGNVYGYQFTLLFDPSRASVVDAEPESAGVQAGQGDFLPGEAVVAMNRADNTRGKVEYACSLVGKVSGREGYGKLGSIALQAKTAGRIGLNLSNVRLAAPEARGMPVRIDGGIAVPSASGVDQRPEVQDSAGQAAGFVSPASSVPATPVGARGDAPSSLPGLLAAFAVLAAGGALLGNRMSAGRRGSHR